MTRDIEHGRKTWREWHKKDNPRKEFSVVEKLLDEEFFVPIGRAEEILYSSDKWERDGDHHDYVHEFESHPKVYIPESHASEDERIGRPAKTTTVLGLRTRPERLVVPQLARVQSMSYVDKEGDLVEIRVGRHAIMGSSPDRKTLIILAKNGPVLVRGGQMRIEARGIVK